MDEVVNELKERRRVTRREKETFKNKIRYYSVVDELNDEISKGRVKPSNIKNRKYYGRWYSFLQFFGF